MNSVVSMNMWGLYPELFDYLENGFDQFLHQLDENDLKAEYLLPTIIDDLLKEGKVSVEILKSHDSWFGVTYKEDKEDVKENIRLLIEKGVYPAKI